MLQNIQRRDLKVQLFQAASSHIYGHVFACSLVMVTCMWPSKYKKVEVDGGKVVGSLKKSHLDVTGLSTTGFSSKVSLTTFHPLNLSDSNRHLHPS